MLADKTKQLLYLQLAEKIRYQILGGIYSSYTKLPSIRELSKEAGVNPNTIQRVFNLLKKEKLIEKHSGHGFFVTSDLQHISKVRQDTTELLLNAFLQDMHQIRYSNEIIYELIENWKRR